MKEEKSSWSCIVGIDCHRDSIHVHIASLKYGEKSLRERYCRFEVSRLGVDALCKFVQESELLYEDTVDLVVIESCGPYAYKLYAVLVKRWEVCLLHPSDLASYGKMMVGFDVRKMVLLGLQGFFEPTKDGERFWRMTAYDYRDRLRDALKLIDCGEIGEAKEVLRGNVFMVTGMPNNCVQRTPNPRAAVEIIAR